MLIYPVKNNRVFAYAKTKTQISFALTVQVLSAFVFTTNERNLAISCGATSQFVSDLVGDTEFMFSRVAAHFYLFVGGRTPRTVPSHSPAPYNPPGRRTCTTGPHTS